MKSVTRSAPLDDTGKLILRLVLAGLLLFHGTSKLMHGIDGIVGMVAKQGLPAFVAYFVYVGEVVAPLLVLVGFLTRPAALVIAINMVVAVFLVHTGQLLELNKAGGWQIELQAFYFGTALALVFLGAGRFSAGGAAGRWN